MRDLLTTLQTQYVETKLCCFCVAFLKHLMQSWSKAYVELVQRTTPAASLRGLTVPLFSPQNTSIPMALHRCDAYHPTAGEEPVGSPVNRSVLAGVQPGRFSLLGTARRSGKAVSAVPSELSKPLSQNWDHLPGVRYANRLTEQRYCLHCIFAHIWVLGDNSTKLAHRWAESQGLYTLTKIRKLLPTFWLVCPVVHSS